MKLIKQNIYKIALEKAQKQEELLELYRKYFNVTEHWYETNNSGNIRKETAIEIEKLESELESIKRVVTYWKERRGVI